MKRTQLANATVLALALIAAPVLAQTYNQNQGTQPSTTTTDQTRPTDSAGTTTPSTDMSTPSTTTGTTTTTTTEQTTTSPTSTTDQSLPATGSPMPVVIAVSLAAMAVGAWLSRPQPRI